MKRVKYSVIIPVYNAEKTLCKCVESILNENEPNVEIILINDGSTDNSLSICKKYSNKYGNVITIDQPNGGASSARNEGLKSASGEYITFIDSDDFVFSGYFSALNNAGDADLVVFGMAEDDGKNMHEHRIDTRWRSFEAAEYVVKSRACGPWDKRYKRSIIFDNSIEFPPDLNVGEDFIFCLKYALKCKNVTYLSDVLYCYNVFETGSLTRKFRPDYIEQAVKIYEYAFYIVGNCDLNEQRKENLMSLLDYNYCRTAFACAAIPVRYKENAHLNVRKEITLITNAFYENLHYSSKSVNLIHRIMRFNLRIRCLPAFYFIAILANIRNKRKA